MNRELQEADNIYIERYTLKIPLLMQIMTMVLRMTYSLLGLDLTWMHLAGDYIYIYIYIYYNVVFIYLKIFIYLSSPLSLYMHVYARAWAVECIFHLSINFCVFSINLFMWDFYVSIYLFKSFHFYSLHNSIYQKSIMIKFD